jgi:hypothetical protein
VDRIIDREEVQLLFGVDCAVSGKNSAANRVELFVESIVAHAWYLETVPTLTLPEISGSDDGAR